MNFRYTIHSTGFMHCLSIILAVPFFAHGQEVRKMVLKETRETYHVLKSDKSIMHGSYDRRGRLNEKIAHGMYTNGARTGIWEFYEEGVLSQKYDFSKRELVYFNLPGNSKSVKYKIIIDTNTLETQLSRPPLYIGGSYLLAQEIFSYTDYPKEAHKNGIEGDVLVSFIIDEKGRTSNYKIVKGIGFGCDEEAIRTVQKTDGKWVPAKLNTDLVKVMYIMPVRYRLND